MGKTIEIKTRAGSGSTGYLALPEAQHGPGLLLIQEVFGVNSHIRECADLFAAAGYSVLAPDLFWRIQPKIELGYGTEDLEKAMTLAVKLDKEQALQDLEDAVNELKRLPQCASRVGAIGYCMGGSFAYRLATHDAVDAAVSYYGGQIAQSLEEATNLHCPIMMHFGDQDKHIPPTTVAKIATALKDKGHVEIFQYHADHGFNCDQRASYNRFAAMLAYGRTAVFLNKMLT